MKKVFLIIALLLAGMTVSAQEWERKTTEADEMLGTTADTLYEWRNADCVFTFSKNSNGWSVKGFGFKPGTTHLSRRNNFLTYARIGFYNENDSVLSIYDNCKLELTEIYCRATSDASRKKEGQYAVNDYLKNEKGYVRILIPLIRGGLFDVSIPCMNK